MDLLNELTHIDSQGKATMVDVGGKPETERLARATAVVRMSPASARAVERGDGPKGDVTSTARIAGVQAAKRTSELIPMAHNIALTRVDLEIEIDADAGLVTITSEARCVGRTGVEMEALTAASIAALTVYDMTKALEPTIQIDGVALIEKRGGKTDWKREG